MSSNIRIEKRAHKVYKRFRRNKKSIRVVALGLAAIMVLSIFSANLVSIVDLLTVGAATYDETDTYTANLTLYDYYNDSNLGYSSITDDTDNRVFNTALHDAGYSSKCEDDTHSWDGQNLKYFPLYLGLQYPNNAPGIMNDESYNYSMTANSEGNSSKSGAALGLVDDRLSNGVLTQGDGTVTLPYFDGEFLNTPITKLLSSTSQSEFGVSSTSTQTLGKMASGYKFNFIKNSDGYYEYNSTSHSTVYNSTSKTFTASTGTTYTVVDSKSKSGFFPWDVISGKRNGAAATNYGYGAKFEIPFTMSSSGKIVDMDAGAATTSDITFNFRGDDDVWVFIDDYLVLDVGGAHGAVSGSINFGTKTAKTDIVKSCSMYHHTDGCSVNTSGSTTDISATLDALGLYDDPTKEHKITVYYIERGELESNCMITFNFQIADSLSVSNNLDTSNVNDFFVNDTVKAANQEGIEYVIASNGGTSSLLSPDAGKETDSAAVSSSYCTITFDLGSPSYGACSAITAKVGTRVKLPSGYSFNRSGYYLLGWSLNSDGSGTVYNSYDVVAADANTTKTFYAVWAKKKISLDEVPEPLLLFINGFTVNYGDPYSDYPKDTGTTNKTLVNYTKKQGEISAYYQTSSNAQYPRDAKDSYTAGGGLSLSNDYPDNLKMYPGYLYVLDNADWVITRYDTDATSYDDDMTTAMTTFVQNYFALYKKLCQVREEAMSTGDETLASAYKTALSVYLTAISNSVVTEQITNLQNALDSVSYEHEYAFSSATTKLYIYSETALTGSVTITNNQGLSGNTFTVRAATSSELPSSVSTGNYYVVEVPTYIVDTKKDSDGTVVSTENIDPVLSFSLNSGAILESTTVSAAKGSTTTDYPCYYPTNDRWKGIEDPDETYAYSSDTKILWLYSASGTPGTVTYSDPYGKLASKTVTPTLDITSYYYIEVPKTVIKTSGSTTESQSVNLSFTLNGSTVSTSVSSASQTAPCYFNTGSGNGWYNLVTVGVINDGDTSGLTYIHTWSDSSTVSHPIETAWASPLSTKNISGTNYYYYYLPYNSNFKVILRSQDGNSQSSTYTLQSTDTVYGKNGTWTGSIGSSGSYTSFYPYTATYKASTLKASAASLVAQATVIEDEILPDDSAVDDEEDTSAEQETQESAQSDDTADSGDESAQTSSDDTQLAASGDGDTEGQFMGTSGTYAYASKTNFKLYDSAFARSSTSEQNFVIRQTKADDNGAFNLMFGQTATFTYQFRRKSGLKVAQTGSSYHYAPDTTNTVLSANADKTLSSANAENGALYNRYSTKWVVKDDVNGYLIRGTYNSDGSIATQSNNYSVYPTSTSGIIAKNSTAQSNAMTKSSDPALYVDNIYEAADANTGIHLTVEYENTVLTGNLSLTKELTTAAIREIEKYRTQQQTENPSIADSDLYNPKFAFQITFSDYFGGYTDDSGVSTHSEVYNGTYYLNGTACADYQTVAGVDNCIVFTYEDIIDDTTIEIKDIPVDTKFEIVEIIPDKTDDDEPGFQLNTIVQTVDGETDTGNATISVSEQKITGEITSQTLTSSAVEDTSTVGVVNSGALAQYYSVDTDKSRFDVVFTNDLNGAYIKIVKTINELYYGKNDSPNEVLAKINENITDFANDGITLIPGATTSTVDPNGYQDGTDAEQTFIFRIREYSDSSFLESALVNTFYETISFGNDDTSFTKSVLIQADPNKYYLIDEVEDWSWKYDLNSVTLLATTSVTSPFNGVISGKTAKIHDFGQIVSFNGSDYTHSDQVTFKNNKKTDDTEDIEGDTSVMVNIIRKAS